MTASVQAGEEKRMPSFKFFGKVYTLTRENCMPFIVGGFIFVCFYFYFSLAAVGGMLTYLTGIPMVFTIIATFLFGSVLTKIVKANPKSKNYVSFLWRLITFAAIYWTIYYSDWSKVAIALFITTVCISIIIKSSMQDRNE